MPEPLLLKVDAVQIVVPDLDAGLAFYRDKLGHELRWRTATAAGLGMGDGNSELVLQTSLPAQETDLLVESADEAGKRFTNAGGRIIAEPSDIPVGRVTVVEDPWGNRLVLLDLSKGTFDADDSGNVTGVS